jgi:hypothetical protein
MSKSKRKFLAVSLTLLALVFLTVSFLSTGKPALALTFLTYSNDAGRWIARFSITNTGSATAISFPTGGIEIFGQSQSRHIPCEAGVLRLLPGKADVIDAFLPQRMDTRWRFTCHYACNGIRARIFNWQWGKNGPGARANWMVPQFLKGIPLDVQVTSDWIEPEKP